MAGKYNDVDIKLERLEDMITRGNNHRYELVSQRLTKIETILHAPRPITDIGILVDGKIKYKCVKCDKPATHQCYWTPKRPTTGKNLDKSPPRYKAKMCASCTTALLTENSEEITELEIKTLWPEEIKCS